MDLILADVNRVAIGQISSFDLDVDVAGSKDFELSVYEAILKRNEWIYIPNTEIGGIVDSIAVNSETRTITYKGRSFRGILHQKIISVPSGAQNVSAQGSIKDEINERLTEAGLSDIFECVSPETDEDSDVDFDYRPFCTLYEGITELAASINFKLIYRYDASERKVFITPTLVENFTDFLTYTKQSSVGFQIEDNAQGTNHFILIGFNENKRYQISLYLSEDGQVMDFTKNDDPVKDSDYILDSRNQQLFGVNEKTEVDITDSINPVENYVLLTSEPTNWSKKYANYYEEKPVDEDAETGEIDVEYQSVTPVDAYKKLTSAPSDWSDNYKDYFEKNSNGEYKGVSGTTDTTTTYKKVKNKPKKWKKNFKDYYYYVTDGLEYFYVSISGKSKDYYKKQKYKPSDWSTNWKQYYQVDIENGKTKYNTAGTTYRQSKSKSKKKKNSLVKETAKSAPKWVKNKYYTKVTKAYAPKFQRNKVYVKIETKSDEQAPTFVTNKYYNRIQKAPPFKNGYYKKVLDHYAPMINKCLESLGAVKNKQSITINDFDADIGDVVGGYEDKTGILLAAPVINIIYRIERGIKRSIDYEIGGL